MNNIIVIAGSRTRFIIAVLAMCSILLTASACLGDQHTRAGDYLYRRDYDPYRYKDDPDGLGPGTLYYVVTAYWEKNGAGVDTSYKCVLLPLDLVDSKELVYVARPVDQIIEPGWCDMRASKDHKAGGYTIEDRSYEEYFESRARTDYPGQFE